MSKETLEIAGKVATGIGDGAHFTRLDWVVKEFRAKLGFEPFPGTFNLQMSGAAWQKARKRLLREPGVLIEPMPGFCAAKCFSVVVGGQLTGAIVFPEVPDYPPDKLEVISPVPIRRTLGVDDGESVVLRVVMRGRATRAPARSADEAPSPPRIRGSGRDQRRSGGHAGALTDCRCEAADKER